MFGVHATVIFTIIAAVELFLITNSCHTVHTVVDGSCIVCELVPVTRIFLLDVAVRTVVPHDDVITVLLR